MRRKLWSFKEELLLKSREAMLNAVQTFNNPNIRFKTEAFIILSNIAWTYLLHAYYRGESVEYRYHKIINNRKRFDKTKRNAFKYWELERCLDTEECPLNIIIKSNLKFLIGLRHEIEHQMTTRIDDYISARLQACCLNYNDEIKRMFGERSGIDKYLSFSLQFSTISEDHANQLRLFTDLPPNIAAYINAFDDNLEDNQFNDIRYSYRVLYVPKAVNHKGQADKVIEFINANSPEAEMLNKEYVVFKDREKNKHLPSHIWKIMQQKGFKDFAAHQHTQLWKTMNAKDPRKGYGVQVENTWYWYDSLVEEVEKYCISQGQKYRVGYARETRT
jgi:hypothetical protein